MRRLALTVVAVLTLPVGLRAQPALPPDSSATIATLNGEPVTQADLDRIRTGRGDRPVGSLLVDLIDERLLVERGKSLGYTLSQWQYEMILENVKKANGLTSDEAFDNALAGENLTRAQLRAGFERSFIVSRVLGSEALAQVSDEEAHRYFDAHLDEFPLQTFDQAKPEVLARLTADRTPDNGAFKPYLQSLRNGAAIVWTQPGLQQAYEQATR